VEAIDVIPVSSSDNQKKIMSNLKLSSRAKSFFSRHDSWSNDTQQKDTWYSDTQNNSTRQNVIQQNDLQHNDIMTLRISH
jgi:hypothetical protein